MSIVALIFGILLILGMLQDSFESIVLPRRVSRKIRLSRFFYITSWLLWSMPARKMHPGNRREYYLSYFGPLSLILLIVVWASVLILGFALVQWGLGSQVTAPEKIPDFGTDLYMSGTTFVTLGLGDVQPHEGVARVVTVLEAGMGFAFLALIIGYVPVIYQGFSKREINISSLDARAGSPPTAMELLRRHCKGTHTDALVEYLRDWEKWCAELLESHLSYPVLTYYRSQHERQSWLAALTVMMDVCALIMVGLHDVPIKPAKFVFAIARHAAVDLAQVYGTPPTLEAKRLSRADFARLRDELAKHEIYLSDGEDVERKLAELRGMYEPFVDALSKHLLMPLPGWMPEANRVDDWETSAWDHFLQSTPRTMDRAIRRD
jgi:hypothetical protein